mmetsp:Transcript_63320/g.76116  ORF Transcript_63320/g.76116 Transcript_63320/m.76116 type:complete len:89 (-) Transcript_63320:176-442(-)
MHVIKMCSIQKIIDKRANPIKFINVRRKKGWETNNFRKSLYDDFVEDFSIFRSSYREGSERHRESSENHRHVSLMPYSKREASCRNTI